ncbi:hypothetical protein [Rhizobium sp. WL3]|nr:hypothetical protein [Rhizobium sp. WL3]
MTLYGHMERRPNRSGWGVEIDKKVLLKDDYMHRGREITRKPERSTAYP